MKTKTKAWIWFLATPVAVGCAVAIFGMVVLAIELTEAVQFQEVQGEQLRKELGFVHGSPYVKTGGRWAEEVFTLHPEPGGIMSEAGVEDGDIVLDDLSITEFYKALHESRGRPFKFNVVEGGDGGPLKSRTRRVISLIVPLKG